MSKYGVLSDPYFSVFGLNTGKYGAVKTPSLDTFRAVHDSKPVEDYMKKRGGDFFKGVLGHLLPIMSWIDLGMSKRDWLGEMGGVGDMDGVMHMDGDVKGHI